MNPTKQEPSSKKERTDACSSKVMADPKHPIPPYLHPCDVIDCVEVPIDASIWKVFLYRGHIIHPEFENRRCLGITDTDRAVIVIADVTPVERQLRTWAHELCHAIANEFTPGPIHLYSEESMAELFSRGIDIFRRGELKAVEDMLHRNAQPQPTEAA